MSEEVKSKIKKIVADHLGIEEEKVTEEASFIDDLGADSLDTVELVMAFGFLMTFGFSLVFAQTIFSAFSQVGMFGCFGADVSYLHSSSTA